MVSERCLQLVREFEGLRLKAYKDPVGIWTIGYGITGSFVKEGDEWTKENAEEWLRRTCRDISRQLKMLPITVNQNQLDALVSFVYNVGFALFLKSSIYTYLVQKNNSAASKRLLLYIKGRSKGKLITLPGLVRRRWAEYRLFNEPVAKEVV